MVIEGRPADRQRSDHVDEPAAEGGAPAKALSPAARRALAEAAERRRTANHQPAEGLPDEIDGPSGPEPTRYGDWAFKGRVTDF